MNKQANNNMMKVNLRHGEHKISPIHCETLTKYTILATLLLSLACANKLEGRLDSAGSTEPGQTNAGCGQGDCGDSTPPNRPESPPELERFKFNCTPSDALSSSPLRRLSKFEYTNTVSDLVGFNFPQIEKSQILSAIESVLESIPSDSTGNDFDTQDSGISQSHVNAHFAVAEALSEQATLNSERLTLLAGNCATENPVADECVTAFIRDFGLLSFRRPMTAAEVDTFHQYYREDSATGFRTLVFAFLMSKDFFYRLELEGEPVVNRSGVYALNTYEIASRLSYYFWGTMPDEELLRVAALPSTDENALANEKGYQKQLERIFDPQNPGRTRQLSERFFSQWLELDHVALPHSDMSSDPNALKMAMIQEVEALTDYYTWSGQGSYQDLLLSELSFAQGPLAEVYGVEAWSGNINEPVGLQAGQRVGLLTRAALLSTGGMRQNAMLRGARIYREVLCGDIEIPNPDDVDGALEPPTWTAEKSTRQLYAETTEGGYCLGCHSRINPLGFAFENYDAVGRFQREEKLSDETGDFIHTIDASTSHFFRPGESTQVKNGMELSHHLSESGKGAACMVRSYFRFAYGREEDGTTDICVLEDLRQRLDEENGSFASMFKGVALQPEFRLRKK